MGERSSLETEFFNNKATGNENAKDWNGNQKLWDNIFIVILLCVLRSCGSGSYRQVIAHTATLNSKFYLSTIDDARE